MKKSCAPPVDNAPSAGTSGVPRPPTTDAQVAGRPDSHGLVLSGGRMASDMQAARANALQHAALAFGPPPNGRALLPKGLRGQVPTMLASAMTLAGGPVLPPDATLVAPGPLAKVLAMVSQQPFSEIVTQKKIQNQFSHAAIKIINDRINRFKSEADKENLRSLYENIKFYTLQEDGRQRYVTKLAIMKLAHKFGLSVLDGDSRVNLYFDIRKEDAPDIIENPDVIEGEGGKRDPISDMLTLVRGLLTADDAETAADVFFERLADESTRAALMAKYSVCVFGLLTSEERQSLMSAVPAISDIADFARILRASTDSDAMRELHERRLSRALAYGAEEAVLKEILQNLLMSDTSREVGFSLLATALFYGDAKTANAFEAAYEAIPGKPVHWYSGTEIYRTWKLHEDPAGSSPAMTRLEGLYVHFARLAANNPSGGADTAAIMVSIKALAKICPKMPLELRDRIIQKLVHAYLNLADTRQPKSKNDIHLLLAKTLKSLRAQIYDDDLILACDKIVINHDYAEELPFYVSKRFTDPEYLIKCIQARDERSLRALYALVKLREEKKDNRDLTALNLEGFVIKPHLSGSSLYTRLNLTGADFDFVYCPGINGVIIIDSAGFKTLRAGGRTDFTKFTSVVNFFNPVHTCRWADQLEDVTITAAEMLRQYSGGCRRFKNVTIVLNHHYDRSIDNSTFSNNDVNLLKGIELENCRFVGENQTRDSLMLDGVRKLVLSRVAYDGLRNSGINRFSHITFIGDEMLDAPLDGTEMTAGTFESLYRLGRRKFSGVKFVIKDKDNISFSHRIADISGCEFENCVFERDILRDTKVDAIALRSLIALGITDISNLTLDYDSLMEESLKGLTLSDAQVEAFYKKGRVDFSGANLSKVVFHWVIKTSSVNTLVLDGCILNTQKFFRYSSSPILPRQLKKVRFVGKSENPPNLVGFTFIKCQIKKNQIVGAILDKGSLESLKTCGIKNFTGCDLSHPSLVDTDLNGCTIDMSQLLVLIKSGRTHFTGIVVKAGGKSLDASSHFWYSIKFTNCQFIYKGPYPWIWSTVCSSIHVNDATILSLKENGVTNLRGLILDIANGDCLDGLRIR